MEIGRGGWLTILAAIAGAVTMVIVGMAGIAVGAVMIGVIGVVAAAVVSSRTHSTRWVILLLTALLPLTSLTLLAPAAQAVVFKAAAPGDFTGWRQDFVDDFNSPLDTSKWGRYESSNNQIGMLSEYDAPNVYTDSGSLVLRTYNAGGVDWRAAGVSGAKGFSAAQGKWTMRAKFDRAYGIGCAFLLYPKGGGWPPEVDIAEGTAGGPRVMSPLHWSPGNLMDSRFKYGIDMTQWHTYGVLLTNDKVEFTVDGTVWTTINNPGSPRIPMWIGFQTGAKAATATATGEVVNTSTPQDSRVYVDWVAHWTAC